MQKSGQSIYFLTGIVINASKKIFEILEFITDTNMKQFVRMHIADKNY
jgi:hypothetical protein